jgi:uncharacterized protein
VSLSAHILGIDEPLGPGGSLLLTLVAALIEFKAFTLFSFLFGVGVAIQTKRTEGHNRTQFLLRRFGALLAIGLGHLLLVWNGDILALYAICGLLLVPLLKLPESAMAALGLLLIGAPYITPLPVPFPDNATLRQLSAGAIHVYRAGTWHELFVFRWRETRLLILPLLLLSFPRRLGLMLWGVAAWRRGFLEGNRRLWLWVMVLGATLGVTGLIPRNEQLATIPLAFGYAAILLLWKPHARYVAAGGQMALTNYLLQSIVFGFVFYRYGFGLFANVGVGIAFLGGLAFYFIQLAWSWWWLMRFYFGPLEWLWRSISPALPDSPAAPKPVGFKLVVIDYFLACPDALVTKKLNANETYQQKKPFVVSYYSDCPSCGYYLRYYMLPSPQRATPAALQ